MKIPKSIRAFGRVYDVKIIDFMADKRNHTHKGMLNNDQCLIELDKTIHQTVREETFLHEIIHLICHNMEIDAPEEDVGRLGVGIYHILKDNKLLAE
jgi:hypothetical protein